ncbi:STAS domain-containing protein [Indiicoccus explosivorum]|uniref:STAS domain-containing protein n=1 Tax=Indiicoccus explosivorum TaxID=1917864 RepID=UPI000B44AE60|nr:STAS domain-containing protein [Indiicoccus explosivorum]
MKAIGTVPEHISLLDALDSIGETIIVADNDYIIRWINTEACRLLEEIAPLYGLSGCEDMIGRDGFFHENERHQRRLMETLKKPHRNRIVIKNKFVTDIVITPIRNREREEADGYIVMLLDVTVQAEEEVRKEELIRELSTPIVNVWNRTIALPLIGEFDANRFDGLVTTVLTECVSQRHEYVLVDLSGMRHSDETLRHCIQKLADALRLIGAHCYLTGISAELAVSFASSGVDAKTFATVQAGLERIMQIQEN